MCASLFNPRDSGARVAVRFRILGQDLALCPECEGRKRFETVSWLSKEDKELRTVPQYDPRTKRRTLVILTDPDDYKNATPTAGGTLGNSELRVPTEAAMKESARKP